MCAPDRGCRQILLLALASPGAAPALPRRRPGERGDARRSRRRQHDPDRLQAGQDRADPRLDPARSRRHGRQPHPPRPALDRPALSRSTSPTATRARCRTAPTSAATNATSAAPTTTTALAVDLVPPNRARPATRTGRAITELALWAEPVQNEPVPPFRWVGYEGDAGHGCGNHLHLSWNHAPAAQFELAEWVEVFPVAPGQPARTDAGDPPPSRRRPRRRNASGRRRSRPARPAASARPHRRRLHRAAAPATAAASTTEQRRRCSFWTRCSPTYRRRASDRLHRMGGRCVASAAHSPPSLCLAALAALALAVAGCGHKEESTPVACLEGSKAYLKALEAAPGEVLARRRQRRSANA